MVGLTMRGLSYLLLTATEGQSLLILFFVLILFFLSNCRPFFGKQRVSSVAIFFLIKPIVFAFSLPSPSSLLNFPILGSSSNDDGDGNENQQLA